MSAGPIPFGAVCRRKCLLLTSASKNRTITRWPRRQLRDPRPSGVHGLLAPRGTLSAMSVLLLLDGQLGSVSFTLRSATASIVLAALAAFHTNGRHQLWSVQWGLFIAAVGVVTWAPSLPIALMGFLVALVAIEIAGETRSLGVLLEAGLAPACLSYLALRFVVDLVARAGLVGEAITRCADAYVNHVRGLDVHLSFTTLGGPEIILACLCLVWNWRWRGGVGRLVVAISLPTAWFVLLPIVAPEVSAGPMAAFSRGAAFGLLWLGLGGLVAAFLPTPIGRSEQALSRSSGDADDHGGVSTERSRQQIRWMIRFLQRAGFLQGAGGPHAGLLPSSGLLSWPRT